jgi:hypothetical protein
MSANFFPKDPLYAFHHVFLSLQCKTLPKQTTLCNSVVHLFEFIKIGPGFLEVFPDQRTIGSSY